MAAKNEVEKWSHDALASDLASHLAGNTRERMIWENMQLGPSGSMRPDVYAIECSYSRFVATAYEVKVTRSDFLSDVNSGKALQYLQVAGRLIYAVPAGLVQLGEIPHGCGLIVRHPGGGWRHVRKPKVSPVETLPQSVWMKLLIDGCARERRSVDAAVKPRKADAWTQADRVRRMFGNEIGNLLRNRNYAADGLRRETEKLEAERAATQEEARGFIASRLKVEQDQLAAALAELEQFGRELGMEGNVTAFGVRQHLQKLRTEHDRQRLEDAAQMMRRHGNWAIEHADKILSSITPIDESHATQ